MNDTASALIVELAGDYIGFLSELEPRWCKAYCRLYINESHSRAQASYEFDTRVELVSAVTWPDFYDRMLGYGAKLFAALEQKRGVMLLTVDLDYNYKVDFEWDNLNRWEITKMDGATGRPEGI